MQNVRCAIIEQLLANGYIEFVKKLHPIVKVSYTTVRYYSLLFISRHPYSNCKLSVQLGRSFGVKRRVTNNEVFLSQKCSFGNSSHAPVVFPLC